MTYAIDKVVKAMHEKGYRIHQKPYVPNITGIRTCDPVNEFNDTLLLFWKDNKNAWKHKEYRVTTDPGKDYLVEPENEKGTAILSEGQYRDAFKHGVHKKSLKNRIESRVYRVARPFLPKNLRKKLSYLAASHNALVQSRPLTVYRDNNKDEKLDFDESTKETGMFFLNIHRSDAESAVEKVGKYSAGCQTFKDPKEYDEFIGMLEGSLRQDAYDYTLMRDVDLEEVSKGAVRNTFLDKHSKDSGLEKITKTFPEKFIIMGVFFFILVSVFSTIGSAAVTGFSIFEGMSFGKNYLGYFLLLVLFILIALIFFKNNK
jgi:hypothetical protein